MASLFLRWVFPESGFDLWTELSRNDHGVDFRDYFLEPEHALGHTIGFRKTLALEGNRILALETEITNLQRRTTAILRAAPTYYSHHIVTEGYTHRGQGLGAWVGPAGSAQYLGAKLFAPWGRAGLMVQRRVLDNDAYYASRASDPNRCCHHAFLDFGVEGLRHIGSIEASASGIVTHEFNRHFVYKEDRQNLSLRLEGRWRPR
jgi:hypothetical protein